MEINPPTIIPVIVAPVGIPALVTICPKPKLLLLLLASNTIVEPPFFIDEKAKGCAVNAAVTG